jgi:hypothetical protein
VTTALPANGATVLAGLAVHREAPTDPAKIYYACDVLGSSTVPGT